MNTHEFKSRPFTDYCVYQASGASSICALPASADVHMSAQTEATARQDYVVTVVVSDDGSWPRIEPKNLCSHIGIKLPSGLSIESLSATTADASQRRIAELETREESAKCLLLRYDALAAPFAVLGESKVAALENYLTANRAKIAELEAALQKITDGNNECCGMCTARLALKEKE